MNEQKFGRYTLEELEELEGKTTQGIWDDCLDASGRYVVEASNSETLGAFTYREDAHAVATIHNAFPDLVKEVRRLRVELEHQFEESTRKLYKQAHDLVTWGNENVARTKKAEAERDKLIQEIFEAKSKLSEIADLPYICDWVQYISKIKDKLTEAGQHTDLTKIQELAKHSDWVCPICMEVYKYENAPNRSSAGFPTCCTFMTPLWSWKLAEAEKKISELKTKVNELTVEVEELHKALLTNESENDNG